jgi:type II secretory pathway component PulC
MTARIPVLVPLLFITILCVGLVEGGYMWFEHFVLAPPQKVEVGEAKTTEQQAATPVEGEKKIDYRVILQRNLFGSQPDSEKSAANAISVPVNTNTPMPTNLDFVLMGTIHGSPGMERAVILDKKLQKQELYETGDAIEGAFVKEILKGRVILSANGRDEILDMSEAANERPKVSAAPPAAAQRRTPVRVVPRPFASVAPKADQTGVPTQTQTSALKPTERKNGPARVSRPSRQIMSD